MNLIEWSKEDELKGLMAVRECEKDNDIDYLIMKRKDNHDKK